ncbi:hypothetical protein OC842_007981, partial [Tilletia horrida]
MPANPAIPQDIQTALAAFDAEQTRRSRLRGAAVAAAAARPMPTHVMLMGRAFTIDSLKELVRSNKDKDDEISTLQQQLAQANAEKEQLVQNDKKKARKLKEPKAEIKKLRGEDSDHGSATDDLVAAEVAEMPAPTIEYRMAVVEGQVAEIFAGIERLQDQQRPPAPATAGIFSFWKRRFPPLPARLRPTE